MAACVASVSTSVTESSISTHKCSHQAAQPCVSPRACDPACRIRDGLFLGSSDSESSLASDCGITHILQVGSELKASHAKLEYMRLAVSDEEVEDLVASFRQAFDFIDAAISRGGAVLVHCAQGMSRSATVVIGYLMWKEHLSYDDALAAVQACRPCVDPNDGFVLQLKEWEAGSCSLSGWGGWGREHFERSLRRSSASGRRILHGYADMIRRFHVHSLTDDDTVFAADDTILEYASY